MSFAYDYENYPNTGEIYRNITECIIKNKDIYSEDNIVIYLINWGCGFGSALKVFMQNSYYLHSLNNRLHILPMFCKNTNNFKYHDISLHNTFFRYFKYTKLDHNIKDHYKTYYIQSAPISEIPWFSRDLPPMKYSPSKEYIMHFINNFKIRIGDSIRTYISLLKTSSTPLVGIHIRSIAQKIIHYPSYTIKGISERLAELKGEIDKLYPSYSIFIATDVNKYIEYANEIFSDIKYLKDISRIDNEGDSIPQLHDIGFKLGSDILYDCLALSLCDHVFITNSNIPGIISALNPDCKMTEYY
jgi:hypothetical protein